MSGTGRTVTGDELRSAPILGAAAWGVVSVSGQLTVIRCVDVGIPTRPQRTNLNLAKVIFS